MEQGAGSLRQVCSEIYSIWWGSMDLETLCYIHTNMENL